MNILIAYDVSDKQREMKNELKAKKYSDAWNDAGKVCNLPNTTLWKQGTTVQQAKQDMIDAAKKLGIRLNRAVSVSFEDWDGIVGDPHTP